MRAIEFLAIAGLGLSITGAIAQPVSEPLPQSAPQPEAEKLAPPPGAARFSLLPADGGYLKLDSITGQVSFCGQRAAGWACQVIPEERAALDAEVARLQGEVDRLKASIAQAEPPRPPGDLTPNVGREPGYLRLPSREEMERARAAVERALRQFADLIYDVQKDLMKRD